MDFVRRAVLFASLTIAIALVACGLDVVGATAVDAPDEKDGSSKPVDDAGPEATVEPALDCPLGDGRTGALCGALCSDFSSDRSNCGGCGVQCTPAQACEGKCVDVATAIQGFRIEFPCLADTSPMCPAASSPVTHTVTLGGTPNKTYTLTLRFRGVVEENSYTDAARGPAIGENKELFSVGGTSVISLNSDYTFTVDTPGQIFRLNAGTMGGLAVKRIGYTARMLAMANTTLTLEGTTKDGAIVANQSSALGGAPVIVPDVPPAPNAFEGQFIQVDVVSVVPVE